MHFPFPDPNIHGYDNAMNPRGRRIALAAFALGLLTLAGAGYAFKDRVVEEYWIWKLESEHQTEREVAAEMLREMKSRKL